MDNIRYCWLNMNTGEFSNSWDEETHKKYVAADMIDMPEATGWKLIKYSCVNDEKFEFYNMMQITTNTNNKNQ